MIKTANPPEPTVEQCEEQALIQWYGHSGYACWYPQMGGYVSKCLVMNSKSDPIGCFDVYVWHDGQFPFNELETGRSPALLHHCDPEQFIQFGETVKDMFNREAFR